MNDQEQKTLEILRNLNGLLQAQNPPMAKQMNYFVNDFFVEADKLFHAENNLEEKNALAKYIKSAYCGGGGLFNDYPTAEDCRKPISQLRESISILLKSYWREMGNECHDPAQFELFPVGAIVEFIVGEISHYSESGVPTYVVKESTNWEVVTNNSTDISDMPEYILSSANSFSHPIARHNALRKCK